MPEIPLDKTTIGAWRDMAQNEAFEIGLRFLERHHAPRPNRKDDANAQTHDSIMNTGYLAALEDVRTILTAFAAPPPEDPSIPSLQR